MSFTRFSVEPIMPAFQVVIGPNIYIVYIPKRQSLTGHPLLLKILNPSSPTFPYSGSSPESRVSGPFQNHKFLFVD
ncbi:hypothetical protein T11_17077 [Trichinella zimbabwensis]|uniref:Uncharacterized protein n=1 Tax=Trichinella zimbabwensis TaxID=268475 RepID=A0A0V1GJU7_9BILA|nr:hypothetical protein T11_17077 [Trichinella zimbabwensis]